MEESFYYFFLYFYIQIQIVTPERGYSCIVCKRKSLCEKIFSEAKDQLYCKVVGYVQPGNTHADEKWDKSSKPWTRTENNRAK